MTSARDLMRWSATPAVLAAIVAAAIYAAAGRTLGFYLGPFFATALILPPLVTRHVCTARALVIAAAVADTFAVAWLISVFAGDVGLRQWLACYVVLAAYTLALVAVTRVTAAWVALVVATLWLTWPVWTSPFVTIGLARWLTPAHPIMAVNSVVRQFGVWVEQPLMYRYTALGQDVPYTLPASVGASVLMHGAVALALLLPRLRRAVESRTL